MKEALKLALEALESGVSTQIGRVAWTEYDCELMEQAITAIKEALAQQDYRAVKTYHEGKPVYVSQPEQEPVGTVAVNDWIEMERAVGYRDGYEAALKQVTQPEQEPVAIHQHRIPYCADWYDGIPDHHDGHGPYEVRTLYTTPPNRPWVGLTFAEICEAEVVATEGFNNFSELKFARAIDAKLKELNT